MTELKVLPASFSRRGFLAKCAGTAACAACSRVWSGSQAVAAADAPSLLPKDKAKVRLVFTHPDPKLEGWPYKGYDYEGRKAKYAQKLRDACPGIEFQVETATTEAEAKRILERDSEVDGYVDYLFGIPNAATPTLAYSGRPTLIVDDLYGGTGTFLGIYPKARAKGMPVAGVSSSRFDDIAQAANAFAAIKKMRASTILDTTPRDLTNDIALFKQTLGTTIRPVSGEELNQAYESADRGEAQRWAKTWIDQADRVLETNRPEIERSAAMYIGMKNLLARYSAQGIAVDCLRLFYAGKMSAYPCLGFFQLNNDGLVGACEADIRSAASMLLITYLSGRPGYISDPVIDTSSNQIIYAHCVAPTKVFGPNGSTNPYEIRTHSEDRKGASIRSLLPLGEMTTTLMLVPQQKLVVMHRAKTVANIEEDRACRTKVAAEVQDARKLMTEWDFGWHRVTVYGDLKDQVETVSSLMGLKVVHEG